jgi:glycosyltransferase involved in cell wall biosynthesis
VVTDVGGNAEIVRDGVSGVVVPCGDVNALAAALERLAVQADLRKMMGKAARRIVEERYSRDTMVAEYERVYRRAMGRRTATP